MGEARQLQSGVLTDIDENYCMHDRLSPLWMLV